MPMGGRSTSFEAVSETLSDYGGFYRSRGEYYRVAPTDAEQLSQALREARTADLPVRIRGSGHSMNGSAVPRQGELLIDCRGLDSYAFDRPGTITVGAGAAIWDVDRLLRRHAHRLLVYNDGNAAASSVGGYVSAGGFGADSWAHGGFWESVESLDILTVDGEARSLGRDDDLFRWLFGSMGQLAVIVAARLQAQPAEAGAAYPLHVSGRVERSGHAWEKILWFSAFVPRAEWRDARRTLAALGEAHASAWRARPPYAYSIPFRHFTPPLIHPDAADLVAIGIWGEAPSGGFEPSALAALEEAFQGWLDERPSARRYAQSELLYPGFDWQSHFGPECHSDFAALKRRLDPANRLGPGLF